jgi:hypothetical protein
MKTGIELIAEERKRQIEEEGYDAKHDSEHSFTEFIQAAHCYLSLSRPMYNPWPWGLETFKPKNIVRDLVRAGALIAAALDRFREGNQEDFEKWANA